MRLFIAVELPDAPREEIVRRVTRLVPDFPPARWARGAGLHVTLAFLGEVEAERARPLVAAIERAVASLASFPAHTAGGGAFPPRGRARVLWLGLEPEQPLRQLAAAARAAVGDCGLACDDKPFRAHLTLARCRPPWTRSERERAVEEVAAWPALGFEIDRVVLVESQLEASGARHTRLAEASLGAAA